MNDKYFSALEKLSKNAVLPCRETKNYQAALKEFLRRGFLKRVLQKGKVFYELTEKALPLLEERRQELLHAARLGRQLFPTSKVYRALLEDLRFLNPAHPLAQDFLFLGDWQLQRPVVPSQLQLAKQRFYQNQDAH